MRRLSASDLTRLAEVRGLKLTPQRRAIVDYLQAAGHHPTPEEVLHAINRRFPMTSRATVYNTLNMLKGEGLLREVFEDGMVRFDPNLSPHHHFICRQCGAVEDVDWDAVPRGFSVALPGGRKVETFSVTLRGLCAGCQRKGAARRPGPAGR